jgi:hypothetical protein
MGSGTIISKRLKWKRREGADEQDPEEWIPSIYVKRGAEDFLAAVTNEHASGRIDNRLAQFIMRHHEEWKAYYNILKGKVKEIGWTGREGSRRNWRHYIP